MYFNLFSRLKQIRRNVYSITYQVYAQRYVGSTQAVHAHARLGEVLPFPDK